MLVPLNNNIPGGDIIINTNNCKYCNNLCFGVGLNNENGIITINEVNTAKLKLSTDKHDIIIAINANVNDFNTIQSDPCFGTCFESDVLLSDPTCIKVADTATDRPVVNDNVNTNS